MGRFRMPKGDFVMGNAYIMVVLGILMAKCLGFFRDMVFAGVFGTGTDADIYFQVFGLVNLIFTGVGVALSTLVIKNMNRSENVCRQKAYASQFLKKSLLWLVATAVAMALAAPYLVKVILPEISGAEFDLAVKLMYVMIPSLIFVVIAYIISGILQNEKVYFITAVMSVPFNIAIILSLIVPNVSILTVGAVTTFGWFLHILVLLPSFYKKNYSFFASDDKGAIQKERNLEILWIFISNMMFQLCFYTDRAFVSGDSGMASTFNYASNLFITISSVFVVAMSTVVFPSISKNYEEGKIYYVNDLLRYIITIMVAIFLPFLLVVGLFGEDVIRLIYERGEFTAESTRAVSTVFLIYSLGILGYIAQDLFNKVLYLAGKYKYSVIGTIAVVSVNILANILIINTASQEVIGTTGLTGTALAVIITTSVFLTAYAVLVAVAIGKVVGSYWKKELLQNLAKIFLSGALALVTYLAFNTFLPDLTHGYLTFIVPVTACGAVYIVSMYFTGVLKALIRKREE